MNLSVIIPNYNGEQILPKNLPKVLEALEAYSAGKVELIIPDDHSSDNSIDLITDFIKKNSSRVRITLIQGTKNMGFSSNINRGVSRASGEILILLNTDVTPSKNFIQPLLQNFEDETIFAVGCMDESVEGEKIVLRGRGVGKWQRGFLIHSAGSMDKKNTLWVSGGSGAFRKSIWDKLNGLDEIYNPFYWEDIDLSYRARKSGYKTVFEKNSVVKHEHEKGAIKKKYSPGKVKKIVYRNQFIFVWKNADLKNLLLNFVWLPYHVVNTLTKGDFFLLIGFFNALVMLPQTAESRKSARRLFVKNDNEVVRELNN